VAGVPFSDSGSAPVPKFLNPGPDPGPAILQIWESDSCSDSGYNHRYNRNLPMFLTKKWPNRLLLVPKWKSDSGSGSGFSQIFDSGSGSGFERKTQNPAGVDSGNPDPVPPLLHNEFTSGHHSTIHKMSHLRRISQKNQIKQTHIPLRLQIKIMCPNGDWKASSYFRMIFLD